MIFDDTFSGWLSFLLMLYWGVGSIVGIGFVAGVVSQVGWGPLFQKRPEVSPA